MARVKIEIGTPRGWVIIDEKDYDPQKHKLVERIEAPAPAPSPEPAAEPQKPAPKKRGKKSLSAYPK